MDDIDYVDIEYVAENISELAVLMALAEEATELSKAAMKLVRAKGLLDNPTPISVEQAEADLIEEYNDLLNCIDVLGEMSSLTISEDIGLRMRKCRRWAERIKSYKTKLEEKHGRKIARSFKDY